VFTSGGRLSYKINELELHLKHRHHKQETTKKASPMKRYIHIRSILIILSALAFLGIPGGSSHAGKPTPVLITVSGAIQGSGTDPAAMAITFSGLDAAVNGSYIANPDRTLRLLGTGRTGRTLTYYYCANMEHSDSVTLCNNVTAHDPWDYKELIIRGGALAGTGQSVLAVFPVNSSWEIWRKARPGDPAQGVKEVWGQLTEPVTYQESSWR
jgi:hypothetical protein